MTAGLKTATRLPSAASVRAIAAATTVLPTSVPVPVTKTPGVPPAPSSRRRPGARGWASEAELAGGGADLPRGPRQLLGPVGRHHRAAQPRGALGHGRRPDPLGEDAALERRSQSSIVALRLADLDRHDLGLRARRRSSPSAASAVAQRRGVRLQPLDPLRLGFEQLQRRRRRADGRRRRRGREDEGAGGVDEEVDRLGVGADVGAVGAERLAEGADDDVDLAAEAGGGDRAATAGADRAGGVRLVDHQPAPWRRASSSSSGSGATSPSIEKTPSVTISAAPAAAWSQAPGEVLEVAVAVDEGLGPGEPAAVDDAGVVELVGEDDLARARPAPRSRRCWRGSRSRTAAPPRSP